MHRLLQGCHLCIINLIYNLYCNGVNNAYGISITNNNSDVKMVPLLIISFNN